MKRIFKSIRIALIFIIGLATLITGVYYGIKWFMTLDMVYCWIIAGAIFFVAIAGFIWMAEDEDFELPTLVWHDNNRILNEINDKLKR